jgi:hypothetical protein
MSPQKASRNYLRALDPVLQSEVFWVALIREYHGDFSVALIRVHRGVFWVDPIRQYRRMLLDLNRIVGRKLNGSEMVMRPGRVTEEHLDPCLGPAGLPI